MHLLGEEKEEEEEDRNGFFQENKEVDNTEQCHKTSIAQAKVSLKSKFFSSQWYCGA